MMEEMNRNQEEAVKEDDVRISDQANAEGQNPPEVGGLLGELPQQGNVEVPDA